MSDNHARDARPGGADPGGEWHAGPNVRPNPSGDRPEVNLSTYLDPTAQIIGKVRVGPRAFIGPYAVLRADEAGAAGTVEPVEVAGECNVQDGAIIHSLGGARVVIGPRTSLSHGCIVHGPCTLGQGCFIGFRAVVFNARLAQGVFVGAGAVVQGVELPAGCLVPAGVSVLSPDQVAALPQVGAAERNFIQTVMTSNRRLAEGYLALPREDEPHRRRWGLWGR